MYIISKEEYDNLPEEQKAEYHKETEEYHKLTNLQLDRSDVRKRRIEGEMFTLISEYINLDRHRFSGGDIEVLSFQIIQDLINDYIEAQRKSYNEFYAPEAIEIRHKKAFKAIDDRHKEIYSKNKQAFN